MPQLLLELFSEEIPARMQKQTPKVLLDNLLGKCVEASLATKTEDLGSVLYVTPRRIGIMLHDLPEQQPDVTIEKKGPKVSAPEKAIEGFLRSTGQKLEDLEKRTVGKDEVYFSVVSQLGKPTAEVLKGIIKEALGELVWPKSMRWGGEDTRWVRPLHSMCCLLDDEVIPVEFGHVTASNTTRGHRFLAPGEITLNAPDEYAKKLQDAFVIADWQTRRAGIKDQVAKLAEKHQLVLRQDEKLLDEVTGLVEWPVALLGTIEDRFMQLPHELLQVTMAAHQKYFTLEDAQGNIAPHFIFAANRTTMDDGQQIIAGNERVLRARFSDAEFFYAQDQKKPLAEWASGLDKVTFHAKLGSVADKVARVAAIAGKLSDHPEVAEAAGLCKADLVTGMVGEFPELQGVMGSYYAKAEGKSEAVCEALYHLYDHPSDLQRLGEVAQTVCMADRLDTLISLFSIDEKPTGSKDPFALRRAALGVIAIIRNHEIRLPLKEVLSSDELLAFLGDRLEADLRDQGIAPTTLRAIGGLVQDDDIIRVEARARALEAFLQTPESEAMLAAYKRAGNILAAEQKKDKADYNAQNLQENLLHDTAERELFDALNNVTTAIQPLIQDEDFAGAMVQFAQLKTPLDTFFDEIMVNTDDAALRTNRLCLLTSIIETMEGIADFKEIIK